MTRRMDQNLLHSAITSAPSRVAFRTRFRTCRRICCQHQSKAPAARTDKNTCLGESRRSLLFSGTALLAAVVPLPAKALPGFQKSLTNRRKLKIPESEYKDGPEGLKYYDTEVGNGATAKEGSRVAVHYDAYWRGITFMTSRQGMGVTGGTPIGFDVGAKESGSTLRGLDLGVRGMRVGGQRKLIVPPELVSLLRMAYGERGMREIPPNATLTMDVQLLSIKSSPFGYRTKLVEG